MAAKRWPPTDHRPTRQRGNVNPSRSNGGDPALLRRLNTQAVLGSLRGQPPVTVTQLGAATSLSRQTVEAVLTDLTEQGWIEETEPERGMGRPARRYRFRAEAGYVLGVDVGVHKLLAVLTDLDGNEVAVRRSTLVAEVNGADRLAHIRQEILDLLAEHPGPRGALRSVCLGVPAIVGPSGRITLSTPIPDWNGLDLANQASRWAGCPALVENDANLAALAERWRGSARFADDCVYILTGHRTGAGLIVGGRLHRGRGGAAGEIGALSVLGWEDEITAELRSANDVGNVFTRAADGDPASLELVNRFARSLAQGAAAMVLTINPDLLIIGGGYSRAGEVLAAPLRTHLQELCLDPPQLTLSTLGEECVALGAVRLALDSTERDLFGFHDRNLPGAPN
ncbi:ROK family transcriptional regulator [Streptacidiphilus sp. P02-A3a]|uniref:ROK family transcriptional regulator n=1 Tax=Streptacidiphilus sp. P02-A3a TaxID=2704468 RepID=UPI0015FADB0E|nr:ROK family transcriptional regulator [Streptacidiphilus sp. P02-A3a]QMU71571.1 ROK family transcriptional regulator [Streptacidiphilus sp. P02-A3a]